VTVRLAARLLPFVLSIVLGSLALSFLLGDQGPLSRIRESVQRDDQAGLRDPPERRRPAAREVEREVEHLIDERRDLPGRLAAAVWRAMRVPLLMLVVIAAALLAIRLAARSRRRYARYWLHPYRADEATPAQVQRLIESWHQMTLRRWWQRLFLGQPSLCLELHTLPGEAGLRIRLMVAVPDEPGTADALDGRLVACYRDSRLVAQPDGEKLDWPGAMVRLKKRRGFTTRLGTPERYEQALVDSLAATMAACGEPCTVQYALTPTFAWFDRFARWLFRSEERQLERARVGAEGADPGIRSGVAQQELEGGLEVQHRPLFFADIRVAALGYRTCRQVSGALRGESGAENRLVERRTVVRRRLYARRIARAVGNPLPSFSRGVLSSSEVCGLWHAPSPFLKGVAIERSSLPRVPAPPEILRPPEGEALLRDEQGPVGIRMADKRMNAALIGGQGTGKTSVMCRSIAADADDPDCAQFVLDGKEDLALKALSVIPERLRGGRRVHYLDFARPEIGIDPFSADADRDAVADGIVEAFKEVHEEGSIQASSDRYLRQAAIACMGWVEKTGQPRATLWDMWTLLLPSADDFRKEVVRAIGTKVELAAPAMFFGQQLPDQLAQARGQFVPRLDSPVNKLQKLIGQPKLDAILRHPLSLSIDEVIRNRDILVVSGAVGSFGEGSARVLLQFILHLIHRAMIRQQELPEPDRARVALKVDEAHLLFSPTFARMLAMDRSAGLECMAAWQALGQIEDRDLRAVVLGLLRHRFVFSVGDDDARQLSSMLQTVYADVMRDDQPARARARITPDALMHLPNFHAACSWIAGGARVPSFLASTYPMEHDERRIEHHIEAQRGRGAHYPGPIAPPERLRDYLKIPDFVPRPENGGPDRMPSGSPKPHAQKPEREQARLASVRDDERPHGSERPPQPSTSDGAGRRPAVSDRKADERAGPSAVPDFAPERSSLDDRADRVGVAPLGSRLRPTVPDTYTELDIDDPAGLVWENPPAGPHKPPLPRRDDLEVLAALHELRFLLTSQIARRFMPGRAPRSVRHRLYLMFKAGWVRRCEITSRKPGHNQRIYALGEAGYELIQANRGRTELARNVDPDARWRSPEVEDPRLILHDLHVAAWLFALERLLAPGVLRGWRGPRAARIDPPGERIRGQWVQMTLDTVPLGTGQHVSDLVLEEFQPVKPDLAGDLDLSLGDQGRRVDALIELDRTGRASSNVEKFRRYDALITAWAMSHPRYKALGEPPIVVFVVQDEEKAQQFLRVADGVVTGRLGKWGIPEASWPHYGRRRLFVVSELDAHQGTLRALRLPEHPPALRRGLHGPRGAALKPEQVPSLVPSPFLRR
jgi:Replication-relaxation